MTVTSLFTDMAGHTPFLSIRKVMAGIGAKVGPGLRGRMGRLEACEESIKGLWVDVGRRRKNNPRSVWLLGDDKATPEEGPPAGGAGCGGGDTSGVEPHSCLKDGQVSGDGRRPPMLGTIGCEEEEP